MATPTQQCSAVALQTVTDHRQTVTDHRDPSEIVLPAATTARTQIHNGSRVLALRLWEQTVLGAYLDVLLISVVAVVLPE